MRRERDPRGHGRTLGSAGARSSHEGRAGLASAGRRREGRRVPVPRVRTASRLVRRAPRPALGRRGRDLDREPRPALPPTPPDGPSGVRGRDGGRTTGVQPSGRHGDPRSSSSPPVRSPEGSPVVWRRSARCERRGVGERSSTAPLERSPPTRRCRPPPRSSVRRRGRPGTRRLRRDAPRPRRGRP